LFKDIEMTMTLELLLLERLRICIILLHDLIKRGRFIISRWRCSKVGYGVILFIKHDASVFGLK
jgi:hypothetical protein